MNEDFRSALDDIKLRLPMEEVVRWYVPELKRQGALFVACCPFHDEKTPSFKVDPRRGTWRCYGACGEGGDQISFVERANRVEFMDALAILAQRAGVELPDRRSQDGRRREDENQPLYDVLERAQRFFARQLRGPGGHAALEYVRSRGLDEDTISEFGLGWAGSGRQGGLVATALGQGVPLKSLVSAGLARETEGGGARDFFFGRLMIPVRDLKGRTVGFGARRLDDEAGGPKYVNTPETVLFHKGTLIYGLAQGLDTVRRGGHLVLVEGYTDVMAAHQVGMKNVVAVLGTSTTDEHARRVRSSGARRVSLVFDGDDAGQRATRRALHGLLPLEVAVDVVRLPGGEDPCDLLMREGTAGFERALDEATDWFEHACRRIESFEGDARLAEIDDLLELLLRLGKPLAREQRMNALAERLGLSERGVREQLESLPARRRELLQRRRSEDEAASARAETVEAPRDERLHKAWRALVGAVLHAPELGPSAAPWCELCPFDDLRQVLQAAVEAGTPAAEGEGGESDERLSVVMTALGDSPARHQVVPLRDEAALADEVLGLFADAARVITEHELQISASEQARALEGADDESSEREAMAQLHDTLRRMKIEPNPAGEPGESPARVGGAERRA